MKIKKKDLPLPEMLLLEARGAIGREAPLNVDVYASVIAELRDKKNYSFGKIAEWLGERLGREINKGIVYRIYSDWCENQEPDIEEPEDFSVEQQHARAVHELEEEILNFTLEKARALGSGGYIINEAVQNVLYRVNQARADEKAATEADSVEDLADEDRDPR